VLLVGVHQASVVCPGAQLAQGMQTVSELVVQG